MTPVIDFLPSSPSRCAGLPVGLPRKKPKKALHKAVVTSGDALDRLATRLEPPFRQAFLNATAALRGHPDLDRLEDALASGASVDDALAVAFSGYQMDLAPAVAALRTAFSQGGHLAAGMLADNIGLSVGFNLRNPRAENWARTAGSTLITQVTNASKDAIRDIVADGMEAGHHPRVMARAIRDFIGLTAPQRSSLANYGAELEAEGLTEDVINKRLERRIDRNIRDRAVLIARTECLPGETLVTGAVIGAVHRRWYEGDLVEVVMGDGLKLRATPNHPMLSTRGWVAAGALHVGDDLVGDSGQQDSGTSSDVDVEARPPTLTEIFGALQDVWVLERRIGSKDDFHGDGREGEVDVLSALRLLTVGRFAALNEPLARQFLTPAGLCCTSFCGTCRHLLPVNEAPCLCRGSLRPHGFNATQDNVLRHAQGRSNVFGAGAPFILSQHVAHRQRQAAVINTASDIEESMRLSVVADDARLSHDRQNPVGARIEPASDFPGGKALAVEFEGWVRVLVAVPEQGGLAQGSADTGLRDNGVDVSSGDTESGGDGRTPLATSVTLHHVVMVNRAPFIGHVYNLSTPFGYFTAQGLYTGNSIRAVHEGQREAWEQAADAGLIDRETTEKKWIATPEDGRTCEYCLPLDEVTVPLDEEFETDLGPVDGPPLHPGCRCAQSLTFPDREETKHYGPGEHPSGSPQDVHGGDGAAEDADEAELRVWRAKRDEAKGVIDKGIAEWSQAWRETPLSPAQQQEYREAAHKVIDWMPRGSLDRFMATIERVNFMPSMEAVRDYYDKTVVGGDSRGMGGFARVSRNINTGVERASVTIDGGYEGGNPRGIYAHEFAHVVDGHTSRSVSGTPEWNSAWHSEIGGERRLLSEYAATSQREGFAEFGRLVYTSPREARDMFPESWAVWKKHGLL